MLYVVSCILFLGCIPARLGQVKIILFVSNMILYHCICIISYCILISCILFLGCIPARLGQVKIIPSLDDFSEIIITSVDYGMITILET